MPYVNLSMHSTLSLFPVRGIMLKVPDLAKLALSPSRDNKSPITIRGLVDFFFTYIYFKRQIVPQKVRCFIFFFIKKEPQRSLKFQ